MSVIVMKGHPLTRKTEFAEYIAASLVCPILALEDVLKNLTAPLSPEQELEAFKVICDIAFHQLYGGIFKNVVIDSPLSSQSHWIHLLNCIPRKVRLIVIECKPTNIYSWKLKFEQHLGFCQSRYDEVKWYYKPKKWEDVEKAIQQHPDYDVTSLSSRDCYVSKLVVDPLLDCLEIWYSDATQPGLVKAVEYMMTRDRGHGPDVIVYRQWLQAQLSSSPLGEKHCSRHGHDIVPSSAAGIQLDQTVDCIACKRQVMRSSNIGDAYCHCTNCNLTLHMECALRSYEDYTNLSSQKSYACKSCEEGVIDKSIRCKVCVFNKHLQNYGCSPVAIEHSDTAKHFLTLLVLENKKFSCVACGGNSFFEDVYLCKYCSVAYHYECITMPRRVKNVHGGHHHHMSLKFENEEAEDYLCQECQELRDPSLWYYSCEDCPGYELHPYCVAKLRAFDPSEMELMDNAYIVAANKFHDEGIEMKEYESISDFYSRVIYLIQWYGDSKREEFDTVRKVLGALPLKFYHIVVAIKRSEEYESMTVDQLMIYLRVYEKRIDNGEDVLIEQVLANLYATQQSSYQRGGKYYKRKSQNLIMNAKDVSIKSVLDTDYSKQESGDNWVKYWGRYWDNYWFNYQGGHYNSQDKSKVQCSICYMFGHDPLHCWKISNIVKKKPLKIKIKLKIKFK